MSKAAERFRNFLGSSFAFADGIKRQLFARAG